MYVLPEAVRKLYRENADECIHQARELLAGANLTEENDIYTVRLAGELLHIAEGNIGKLLEDDYHRSFNDFRSRKEQRSSNAL